VTRLAVSSGELGAFYDERYAGTYMKSHPLLEERRVRDILDRFHMAPQTILDYGCGRGSWLPLLAELFPGSEIAGVDVSQSALVKARRDFPACSFYHSEGRRAPLASGSFDLIFSYHVLEHVYDLEDAVADLARLARPGGYLCIMLPCANKNSFEERIARLIEGGVEPSIDGRTRFFFDDAGHIRRPTSVELVELFTQHGVLVREESFAGHFWGAVEWLSRAGTESIRELFDPRRGRTTTGRAGLFGLRMTFLALSVVMRLHSTRLPARRALKGSLSVRKRMVLAAAAPLRLFAWPVGRSLGGLAWLEWRRRRTLPNGSALYLVLQKGAPSQS
jgi:SAM-dependent methyltransferase